MSLPGYRQALAQILDAVAPVATEDIAASDARGRVLARPLLVPGDMPATARSAMDGFATGSCDRRRFQLVGEVAAGGTPPRHLDRHQAVAVMTGAVVPPGTAAVVKLEQAHTVDGDVLVDGDLEPGQLIDPAGSEARTGTPLAPAGQRLDPISQAAVLNAGHHRLEVYRRPRIGILISGREVQSAGERPRPGGVWDTNSPILTGTCEALGCKVVGLDHVGDDEAATREALAALDRNCDLVVTSGGVSRGRYDQVGRLLRSAPDRLLLAGTAIKPGRPLHVARLESGTLVVAMPGYPSSLLANTFLYLVPALKALSGRAEVDTSWFHAVLDSPLRHRPGRHDLSRVSLVPVDGAWHARPTGAATTSRFLDAVRSQGLARLPFAAPHDQAAEASVTLATGTAVPVLHFALELT